MGLTIRSSRDRFAARLMRYRVAQRQAAQRSGLTQVLDHTLNFKRLQELTNIPTFIAGLVFFGLGVGLYWLASPSRHGYIEIMLAIPLACIGLAIVGASFLLNLSGPLKAVKLTLGLLFILVAATPILYLLWFFIM